MPRDNHPRERQARALERKRPQRPSFDRILIVTEGAKTEPLYFEEIRKQRRISSAHIEVLHSSLGTEPRQVVESAHRRFSETKQFDCVFAVFDRDDHRTYAEALEKACAQLLFDTACVLAALISLSGWYLLGPTSRR